MSLPGILREYGQAFRGDWSNIDGRSIRDEMDDIADWIETSYPGDEVARDRLGMCPVGEGHWTWHCDDDCGDDR